MSAIDDHLDELFDLLAGNGAAGRRLLAEAEDHLYAAYRDGVATGLSDEDAARRAIEHFGSTRQIVRQLRGTGQPRSRKIRARFLAALSTAWRIAVVVGAAAGLSYLVYGVGVRALLIADPGRNTTCNYQNRSLPWSSSCGGTANVSLVIGAALLTATAVLWLTRRSTLHRTSLPQTTTTFISIVVALSVASALVLTFTGIGILQSFLPSQDRPIGNVNLSAAGVALTIAVVYTSMRIKPLLTHG
jgi:hypothetical protein